MIKIDDLMFSYQERGFSLAIDSLQIKQGETLAIVGPSGSGKTTLLNLIAGVLTPDSGAINLLGKEITQLSDAQRRKMRLTQMGMVFQNFELIRYLSVLDNVLLSVRLEPSLKITKQLVERAKSLIAQVGLADKINRDVTQLSQGEQQRVAICRSLMLEPPIILADEPTGNLDVKTKATVLNILLEQSKHLNAGLITVTHDLEQVDRFDRVLDFEQFQQQVN